MQKLIAATLSVLLLSAVGFLPYNADAQTTKYLLYENSQYGFSIKYPSNWQKAATSSMSSVFPNVRDIVTFSSPSGNTNYGVSLIEDDSTFQGLSGQKFLDKIKEKFIDSLCSNAPRGVSCSTQLAQQTTFTHQNGYSGYLVIFGVTMSSDQNSVELGVVLGFYPDGNDVWMIGASSSSVDEFQQYTDELTTMGSSFTIFNYKGEQTAASSTIAKSNAGTLQINSGYFTASKYSPAELIVSGEINDIVRGVPLTIKITKPDKSSDEHNIAVTKDGSFRAPIKIDDAWPTGNYQLSATYGSQYLGSVSFSVNMGGATTPIQTTKFLSYENSQYGFSIKYPSNWQKEETLEKDKTTPNMINIVSFNTPSELTYTSVNLIQDDTVYRGLSGQKFLDKMKNEFENVFCSSAAESGVTCSMEVLDEEGFTHQNGYDGYRAAYGLTISQGQDSAKVLVAVTMIPDGNNIWMIAAGSFSTDEIKNIGKEMDQITDSFTISNYVGEQKQLSLQAKAAQKNNIMYLVLRNPDNSSYGVYSIKLTNVNGKITNFIKIKDWDYVRVGADSVIYQTMSSPLDSSDIIKIALKVDSKNTEIKWEAFSKDQKSLGTGTVKP